PVPLGGGATGGGGGGGGSGGSRAAIVPTQLFVRNRDVDTENARRLASLPGLSALYVAADSVAAAVTAAAGSSSGFAGGAGPAGGAPGTSAAAESALSKHSLLVQRLELKAGAQVMLVR